MANQRSGQKKISWWCTIQEVHSSQFLIQPLIAPSATTPIPTNPVRRPQMPATRTRSDAEPGDNTVRDVAFCPFEEPAGDGTARPCEPPPGAAPPLFPARPDEAGRLARAPAAAGPRRYEEMRRVRD